MADRRAAVGWARRDGRLGGPPTGGHRPDGREPPAGPDLRRRRRRRPRDRGGQGPGPGPREPGRGGCGRVRQRGGLLPRPGRHGDDPGARLPLRRHRVRPRSVRPGPRGPGPRRAGRSAGRLHRRAGPGRGRDPGRAPRAPVVRPDAVRCDLAATGHTGDVVLPRRDHAVVDRRLRRALPGPHGRRRRRHAARHSRR